MSNNNQPQTQTPSPSAALGPPSPPPTSPPRRIIGVTGGIGMGKSTVSAYLSDIHHLPVLDADVFARDVVVPGSPVLDQICDRYGSTILLPDGTLDRVRLGEIIFNSAPERHWLEQQIHPHVRDRFEQELNSPALMAEPIIIVVVPLLFEARMTDLVTEIWVVYCPLDQQIDRLLQRQMQMSGRRYHLNRAQIKARIDSQMSIERKMRHADRVLDNSATLDHLYRQIDQALAHVDDLPGSMKGTA